MDDEYLRTNGIAELGSRYGTIEISFKGSNVPGLYERMRGVGFAKSLTSETFRELKSSRERG